MAGAFTHFMICKKASTSSELEALPRLVEILSSHPTEMFLGSVSPDLPYAAVLEQYGGSRSWADYMHKYQTNGIMINGVQKLIELKDKRDPSFNNKLAWLLGYGSHLIIDAVIHPIVEEIVGSYDIPENRKPHFICEQTQDTFIFKEIEGRELIEGNFVPNNLGKGYSRVLQDVFEFWKEIMIKTYFPEMKYPIRKKKDSAAKRRRGTEEDIEGNRIYRDTIENSVKPSRWNRWYRGLLGQIAGGSLHKLSRHFPGVGEYFYNLSSEIPVEKEREYYTKIKLPNGIKGHFKEKGFKYAVSQVIEGWKIVSAGVFEGKDVSCFYKNWKLDTGIDMETGIKIFWA